MRKSFKEGDDRGKGRDVGGRSTRAERSDVDVATVGYNQNILESVDRTDGKATCEVGGRPLILVDGEGAAPQGQRVNKRRGEVFNLWKISSSCTLQLYSMNAFVI